MHILYLRIAVGTICCVGGVFFGFLGTFVTKLQQDIVHCSENKKILTQDIDFRRSV